MERHEVKRLFLSSKREGFLFFLKYVFWGFYCILFYIFIIVVDSVGQKKVFLSRKYFDTVATLVSLTE